MRFPVEHPNLNFLHSGQQLSHLRADPVDTPPPIYFEWEGGPSDYTQAHSNLILTQASTHPHAHTSLLEEVLYKLGAISCTPSHAQLQLGCGQLYGSSSKPAPKRWMVWEPLGSEVRGPASPISFQWSPD